jgi:hypothetical protein
MPKYIKTTNNPNMGRPKININWEEFEKLCGIFATLEEIAAWFDCSIDTIENKVKEKYDETFSDVYKKKSSKGKISLRRTQFKMSATNATMAIWLGKQQLGQRDILEHSGLDGEPIEHTIIVKPPFSKNEN